MGDVGDTECMFLVFRISDVFEMLSFGEMCLFREQLVRSCWKLCYFKKTQSLRSDRDVCSIKGLLRPGLRKRNV